MRVIAGKAKRLKLKTIAGFDTRPTGDKIKETLFNIISPELADCDFLDLFSGSGAIGIEALSRGANSSVFVENSKAAVACLKDNLHITALDALARILAMDVLSAIRTLEVEGKVFDIIFMDPPYNRGLEQQVLERLQNSGILHSDTMIIVEASKETGFEYLQNTRFQIYRQKEYKTNKHVFIELK
jgi:16S rRNA (guanine966-N2)-methyltransferase